MKLAAIYSVWDGEELLEGSIRQIREHVDIVILVVSSISNHKEEYFGGVYESLRLEGLGLADVVQTWRPEIFIKPMRMESQKREFGLEVARLYGATHFLYMDCDEYYDSNQFKNAKTAFSKRELKGIKGSVCSMYTYFKEPTLKLDPPEEYFVPFIHTLTLETRTGFSNGKLIDYPFYCDPTRRVNTMQVVDLSETVKMHHYSYVRKDLSRKIRNSSARSNIERTPVVQDYANAKEGYFLKYCQKSLILADNKFNIKL